MLIEQRQIWLTQFPLIQLLIIKDQTNELLTLHLTTLFNIIKKNMNIYLLFMVYKMRAHAMFTTKLYEGVCGVR